MNSKLSFVFFGTPDVASETLEILKKHGHIPELIVTSPDRPVGRHFTMTPPHAKVWAIENGIPFIQPEKITEEVIESLRLRTPSYDLFIVVAYGKILPQVLIDIPKLGTLNIHYSLLPRWRGATPVEAAILHGDTETGVSIQKMVFKLDAGPIIAEEKIPIAFDDTTQSLRAKLIPIGAELLTKVITALQSSPVSPAAIHPLHWRGEGQNLEYREQDESLSTHCSKTKKEDALVTLDEDPRILWNKYRAYHGWPCIYFMDTEGKRVKITSARFENSKFIIEKVIPEGKSEMTWNEYKK